MNFDVFSQKLYRMIGEQIEADGSIEPIYSAELIRDGVNLALVSILPWHPRLATASLVPVGKTEYALPDDCYVVDGVYDLGNRRMLEKVILHPGYTTEDSSSNNVWAVFETQKITFAQAVPSTGYKVYYLAYWSELTDNYRAEQIPVSDFLIPALLYYTAAHCMQSAFSNLPQISAFKNKIDSGNPEHNPYSQVIKFFLSMFQGEMNRHSSYQRLTVR